MEHINKYCLIKLFENLRNYMIDIHLYQVHSKYNNNHCILNIIVYRYLNNHQNIYRYCFIVIYQNLDYIHHNYYYCYIMSKYNYMYNIFNQYHFRNSLLHNFLCRYQELNLNIRVQNKMNKIIQNQNKFYKNYYKLSNYMYS